MEAERLPHLIADPVRIEPASWLLHHFVVLIGVVAAASTTGNDFTRMVRGIFAVRQIYEIVRVGLILFLFVFASYFRLRWSNYMFGIAVGLAFYGSVELVAQAIFLHYGTVVNLTYGVLVGCAYDCSVVIWLGYLLTRSNAVDHSFELPTNDLPAWNSALVGMLNGR